MRGVIEELNAEARSGYLVGIDGQRFYFRETSLLDAAFDELRPGSVVEFEAARDTFVEQPRESPSAVDISVSPTTSTAPDTSERGGDLASKPPPGVRGDDVGEASWQSFPASNPPANSGTT